MTATTDTEAALLAAVFSNPDDDTPRVVYADYLDEQADELPGRDPAEMRARAEFIRVQCELERMPELDRHQVREMALREVRAGMSRLERNQPESILLDKAIRIERRISEERTELRRRFCNRGRALLKQWEPTWRRAGECPECVGGRLPIKNAGRFTIASYDCRACWGTGDAGGLLRKFQYHHADYDHAGPSEPVRVRFRRGWLDAVEVPRLEDVLEVPRLEDVLEQSPGCFVCRRPLDRHRYCDRCDAVRNSWQPISWARALRAHRSLTRVAVGCRQPAAGSVQCDFVWYKDGGRNYWNETAYYLPDVLYDALKGGKGFVAGLWADGTEGEGRIYDTYADAVDALAVAVWDVVRG